jgi:ATP-binding cassette subfamily C protein CydD
MMLDRRLLLQARTTRFDLALTIALGAFVGLTLVGQARLLSHIVNGVFLVDMTMRDVQVPLFFLCALSIIRAILTWGNEVSAQRVAGRVKHALRQRLMTHLFTLGPAFTRKERTGELTHTLVEGVEALDAYFSQYLPQLAMAALIPVTILAFTLPMDLTSALILLLTAPLIPIFMILISDAANRLTRRQWTSLSRMSAHFLDILQGLTTLKLLGRSREQVQVIAAIGDNFRRTTLEVLRVTFLSALVLELISTISTAVVAVQVGLRLLYGQLAFEQAFFVLILTPEFYLPLRMLGIRFHAGMSGVTAAKRIFEVLETPVSESLPSITRKTKLRKPRFDIHFEDVHYAYDEGQRDALRGASFHVSPGHKVAIVGPSGSGKSTVAHLLLRFINPDRGTITVDGHNLHSLDLSAWRSMVAWVPQKPYLFNTSVIENIRVAQPEASMEDIVHASQQAYAHDFIKSLPLGYDTPIGERGARLSGGQVQRVALARAFLKNAPFLILDEAMANLDAEIEARLQEAMSRLLQDCTTIIIAHRLGTVRKVNTVLVMARGHVVEAGSHEMLMADGGLYHRLVTAYEGAA